MSAPLTKSTSVGTGIKAVKLSADPCQDVECDEIWAFVQKKEKRKRGTQANDDSVGDAYCYVGIERHSKLVLNFALGRCNQATTDIFIEGLLAWCCASRPLHLIRSIISSSWNVPPVLKQVTVRKGDRQQWPTRVTLT